MKHNFLLLRFVTLGAIAIQLTSCQKILDHWPGHGGENGTVKYRIKSVTYSINNSRNPNAAATAIFHYGSDNLLDTITSPGIPNYQPEGILVFNYDEYGKLIYYQSDFLNNSDGTIVTDIYGYDNNGRVLTDFMTSAVFAYENTDSSHLQYDDKGRVVKDYYTLSTFFGGPRADTVTFNYDANGNRGVVTSVRGEANTGGGNTDSTVYDNKVAYRSTNPIFQLIDRDWSVNNANYATGYNSAGLPLGFMPGSKESFLDLGEPRQIEWEEVP